MSMMNPNRPPSDEFAAKTEQLKGDLLTFASWFSWSFHEQTIDDRNENFEDAIIQTLALANMAMVEALSQHYGKRINVHNLLLPVMEHTLTHERNQKNCPHRGTPTHNCGDHQ